MCTAQRSLSRSVLIMICYSQMSSIVEFQAVDYRMERCVLSLSWDIPKNDSSKLKLGSRSETILLWALESTSHVKMSTLAWNSRPPRTKQIGQITIEHRTNYSYEFACPLNSVHAFEFMANTGTTLVEWFQNTSDPRPGKSLYGDAIGRFLTSFS